MSTRDNFYELRLNDTERVNWLLKRSDDLANRVQSYRGTSHLMFAAVIPMVGWVVTREFMSIGMVLMVTVGVVLGSLVSTASWIYLHWPRRGMVLKVMPDYTQWPTRNGFEEMIRDAETEELPAIEAKVARLAIWVRVGIVGLVICIVGFLGSIVINGLEQHGPG